MKYARHGLLACLIALLPSFLLSCQSQGAADRQAAAQAYAEVRDRFLVQEGYSFHGRTKLVSGDTAHGNLVNFSGQVRGKDVFMHVKLSFPEDKQVDTMSLMSRNEKLYARFHEKEGWKPVDSRDVSLRQEFLNWSPIFAFQQMEEMRTDVLPLRDPVRNDGLEAVRVLLDGERLKSWLAQQMKDQVGGVVRSEHVPKLKMALTMSNEREWREFAQNARIQAEETRREIDEMIEGMELDAECTVYYDSVHKLPRKLVMNIRSSYDLDGQRVHEHTEVETFLQNYGQRFTLPDPAGRPSAPGQSPSA